MRYFLKISLIIFFVSLITLLLVDRGSKEELLLFATMALTGFIALISTIKIRLERL